MITIIRRWNHSHHCLFTMQYTVLKIATKGYKEMNKIFANHQPIKLDLMMNCHYLMHFSRSPCNNDQYPISTHTHTHTHTYTHTHHTAFSWINYRGYCSLCTVGIAILGSLLKLRNTKYRKLNKEKNLPWIKLNDLHDFKVAQVNSCDFYNLLKQR